MQKILVVDDEKLNRAGLKIILSDSFPQTEVLDAKNGNEALKIIESNDIAVMVTDIRMPVMDGVELMHRVSALEKKPYIIVLSGYDDFMYAKEAVNSGAISYILKPVDKKELIPAVTKGLENDEQRTQKVQSDAIHTIIDSGRIPKDFNEAYFLDERPVYCMLVSGKEVDSFINANLSPVNYSVFEKNNNSITIVGGNSCLDKCVHPVVDGACEVSVSRPTMTLTDLRILQRQAFIISFSRLFSPSQGGVKVFYYHDDMIQNDFSDVIDETHKLALLLGTVKNEELTKQINMLFDLGNYSDEIKCGRLYSLYTEITNGIFKRFWKYADNDLYLQSKSMLIENIGLFKTVDEWKNSIVDYILYLNTVLRKDCGDYPFIVQALAFMNENYMKNINMATVANEVSVNYTYFSEKFKEYAGINFNDYLRRLRIEQAKLLLEKGCYKVYEVATRSGFSDVKYFIRNFKEETGLSPTNYRRKVSGKDAK